MTIEAKDICAYTGKFCIRKKILRFLLNSYDKWAFRSSLKLKHFAYMFNLEDVWLCKWNSKFYMLDELYFMHFVDYIIFLTK